MRSALPFGRLDSASILVIGHDPRLQRSPAEAEFAFFMDYLTRPSPALPQEQRKYGLAQAVVSYVGELTGRQVTLGELYVTNLCNQFLPPAPKGHTVLIPDTLACRGVAEIARAAAEGHFRVILPMAPQPFYHLCRLGFIHDEPDVVRRFARQARPTSRRAAAGAYVPTGKVPFLAVCGRRFHHFGIPVVPILHVKQWPYLPTRSSLARYRPLMANAAAEARSIIGQTEEEKHG